MIEVAAWLIVLWRRRRHSGWTAVLVDGDQVIGTTPLGWQTAGQWLADPWARKLGLKSLCADYGRRLSCNVLVITEMDSRKREFRVRYDRNPA